MDSILWAFRRPRGVEGGTAGGCLTAMVWEDLRKAAFTDGSMVANLGLRVGGIWRSSCPDKFEKATAETGMKSEP